MQIFLVGGLRQYTLVVGVFGCAHLRSGFPLVAIAEKVFEYTVNSTKELAYCRFVLFYTKFSRRSAAAMLCIVVFGNPRGVVKILLVAEFIWHELGRPKPTAFYIDSCNYCTIGCSC